MRGVEVSDGIHVRDEIHVCDEIHVHDCIHVRDGIHIDDGIHVGFSSGVCCARPVSFKYTILDRGGGGMVDGEAMVGKTLVGDAMFGSLRWSKSGMLFLRGPSDVEGQFPLSMPS